MLNKIKTYLNDVLESYDEKHYKTEPCTQNIICQREGVRHKTGCPARTVPVTEYTKGLRSLS